MPGKPHTSLARVLDALGDVLLEPVAGTRNRPQHLDGVVIHDPLDTSELPARAVVLGVSVQEPADIARLLHAYGRRGATALVVRQPIETTPEVLKPPMTRAWPCSVWPQGPPGPISLPCSARS